MEEVFNQGGEIDSLQPKGAPPEKPHMDIILVSGKVSELEELPKPPALIYDPASFVSSDGG